MKLALLLLLISISAFSQNSDGLRFVENKGQWNDDIDFQARIPGGRIGVSPDGFSILLLDVEEMEHQHMHGHHGMNESDAHAATEPINGHYFRIRLLGANLDAKPEVATPLDGHYNYFLGNDPSRWVSNAASYSSILYRNVYEGIDFRVSSVDNNLKYDFIVSPGADPSRIRIAYDGVDVTRSGGDIEIATSVGTLKELKPYSYHLEGTEQKAVASSYWLDDGVVSFSFPDDYDVCRELVIDPLLIFSTYSGSSADNWGSTATPGEHGTLYSAGVTRQNLGGFFPATVGAFQTTNHGSFDMAVIKYDSAGTRFLWATHLGGMNNDSPQSLVVDPSTEDLIVLGISSSPDYPTSANAFDISFNFGTTIFNRVLNTNDQWDIVLTRLTRDGDALVGSTFLGGAGNDGLNLPKQSGGPLVANYGDEMRGDVITDEEGNVFISSVTSSADFPIVNGVGSTFGGGITDGLVVKLSPDLSSIIWSSFVGGSGFDAAYSIKFDNDKNVILAGGTTSFDFPVTAGSYQSVFNGIVDGWIARLSSDGSSVINATFTGTGSFDQIYFVDLNSSGSIFCYGQTAGQMPVTAGVYRNTNSGQFVQKLSADLSTLEFSTVFGSGSTNGLIQPNISPTAFLVNDCDNIYMAGWGGFINSSPDLGFWPTSTHGMPVTSDAFQKTTAGSDFYFMVLNGDASKLVYATYLGGSSSKTHVDGGTSRFDKYGIVYHSVCAGCQFGNTTGGPSSDFPTTRRAHSRINGSGNCNNAAFKFDLSSLRAMFDTNNLALTIPGFNNVCYPDSIVFENFSTGGRTIEWDFDDGTLVTQTDQDPRFVIHQYKQAGQYNVKLKITDLSTCSQVDSVTKTIFYFKDNIQVGEDAMVCDGETFRLTASGGVTYNWRSQDGTFTSDEQNPIVDPETHTTYYVTVVDANGCSKTDTLNLGVTPNVHAFFQTYDLSFAHSDYNNICFPEMLRFKNQSVNGEEYFWDFGDGNKVTQTKNDTLSIIHGFQGPGSYTVKLKAVNPNTCNKADSVVKVINYFMGDFQVGEDAEICEGAAHQLSASGGTSYTWLNGDLTLLSSSPTPTVRPSATSKYYVTVTDANNCEKKDTVEVVVIDSVDLEWEHEFIANCTDRPAIRVRNMTAPSDDVTFLFDFGDGSSAEGSDILHAYEDDGEYTVTLAAQKKVCTTAESVRLPIFRLSVPNVFTPAESPGFNDEFMIGFGPEVLMPSDIGLQVHLVVLNRWGRQVFESADYRNDWNADALDAGVYYVHVKVGDTAACKGWLHIIK